MAEGNQSEYVICPNMHRYQKSEGQCPYCPESKATTSDPTNLYSGVRPTGSHGGGETETFDLQGTVDGTRQQSPINNPNPPRSGAGVPFDPNKTGFGGDAFGVTRVTGHKDDENGEESEIRYIPRLVGWLVSYSFDPMGVDFRLYEGKNFIGRKDPKCNIKVFTDTLMSALQAQLLVRGDQYVLKDEMSTHGTFVNDENIGFDPYVLKDGDVIRMGSTTFKFRSSI
jgi:hypothetical protein